mmetsp:Transcript_21266/g.35622  ORF Transcript_21266/g.35622 Transcript_21266/m.35622 type:complete len:293 (+) Transcript_21266:98-976(+)|eukprot:CAMPEP_0174969256 /NCGR_PEP_ID=MMETSP0004_2-20121128/8644_1 /TAXON_ID=420556 /ORGANISM="Ochromonas sp., Strain CCMP1393" /LENGTH=292 /DNA_ID=CAMNT_0016218691 /DNA_START=69 /DNA_END=947 /DNA_ORIENTATION=+
MSMGSAEVQAEVAGEVSNRLERATAELAQKYARGDGGVEDSVTAPTGSAYMEKHKQEVLQKKKEKENRSQRNQEAAAHMDVNEDVDLDEDLDEEDADEDPELRKIRELRLKQMKNLHNQKLENIGKGHGQFREITQDEFIAEVTSSLTVICMFYHRDFPRCDIMEHHLQKLAKRHIESKFVKIDGNKAPFFVQKLMVRTMPTVVIFKDGVAVDKILGFEELAEVMPEGEEDRWPTIVLARLLASKQAINAAAVVDDDEVEATMKAKMMEMRRQQMMTGMGNIDDMDEDFDDL